MGIPNSMLEKYKIFQPKKVVTYKTSIAVSRTLL